MRSRRGWSLQKATMASRVTAKRRTDASWGLWVLGRCWVHGPRQGRTGQRHVPSSTLGAARGPRTRAWLSPPQGALGAAGAESKADSTESPRRPRVSRARPDATRALASWCLCGRNLLRSEGRCHPLPRRTGSGVRAASRRPRTPQDAPLETHTPRRSAETRAEGAAALRVPKSVRQVADGHGTAPRGPGAGPRLTLTWPCDLGPASSPLWAQFLPLRIFAGRLF